MEKGLSGHRQCDATPGYFACSFNRLTGAWGRKLEAAISAQLRIAGPGRPALALLQMHCSRSVSASFAGAFALSLSRSRKSRTSAPLWRSRRSVRVVRTDWNFESPGALPLFGLGSFCAARSCRVCAFRCDVRRPCCGKSGLQPQILERELARLRRLAGFADARRRLNFSGRGGEVELIPLWCSRGTSDREGSR